ncbi:hypothetical protein [Methyloradius palustris]|uniref:hypothetical protein n=1 Tax=Methyloradius palustris TaxID=2778876 RepID=UPI001C8CBF50|nr:hypothetical protein [Methyloradius palustris]
MSKFLIKDQVQIFLHPQQLTLVRLTGRFKKRVLHQAVIPCAPIHDGNQWTSTIAALGLALQGAQWRDVKPTIVLSNHFVRYAVIPWNSLLNNAVEKQAYLKHCFTLAYGESTKSWDLRMSDAGLNMPALASGIDQGLLSAIRDVMTQVNLDCQHIQPHLMIAINQLTKQDVIPAAQNSTWFVLLETGRLCIALISGGAFVSVKTYAAEPDMAQQISALIKRESVICGLDSTDLPVFVSRGFHGSASENLALIQNFDHPMIRVENDSWEASSAPNSISQQAIRT